ncbi:endonuclease [Pelobates cultripes]|uniref:Endonuclease, partial n=1 Tax=Pelobates cultripes TaxID=61616 RepID=A0AAD1RWR5_PELCU|nr:endonuclease [Pelobates cultripes]
MPPIASTALPSSSGIPSDMALVQEMRKALMDYFVTNETPDSTALNCWEAYKTVIHGHLIARCSARKRAATQEMSTLSRDIAELERRHKLTLDKTVYRDLLLKRGLLTALL